jgi:hypothetical protein
VPGGGYVEGVSVETLFRAKRTSRFPDTSLFADRRDREAKMAIRP